MRGHWSLKAFNNVEAEVIFDVVEAFMNRQGDLSR